VLWTQPQVKSGHAFLDISDAELLNIPSCIQATDVKLFFFFN